ncbi:MAG: hypothetical protein NC452_14660 [Eubacterium sp.]|nr:hypothetical protein [Eubacterium sp.]
MNNQEISKLLQSIKNKDILTPEEKLVERQQMENDRQMEENFQLNSARSKGRRDGKKKMISAMRQFGITEEQIKKIILLSGV